MTIKEFDARLQELHLKKTDFMKITCLNKGTVYNWGTSRIIDGKKKTIPIPNWVKPFLEYYEKSKKYDEIRQLLS